MKNKSDPLRDPQFSDLLNRLRDVPQLSPEQDLTERVMAGISTRDVWRPWWIRFSHVAAAAVFLVLMGGIGREILQKRTAPLSPVQILMSSQLPDGRWTASADRNQSRYDTEVTALALLALMEDDHACADPRSWAAIELGMEHLLRQQGTDGRFGDQHADVPFTEYLAGMALRRAVRCPQAHPQWHEAWLLTQPYLPSSEKMAGLNRQLAAPDRFPDRWADAGGPVTLAALELLEQ